MDPLSDALSLLKPRTVGAGGFDMGGDWSIKFPEHEGIKCYAVVAGQCRLVVDGVPDHAMLVGGDAILLGQGKPFRLASDLDMTSVDYASLPRTGGVATGSGGGDCFIVGGHFTLEGVHADMLMGALPPVVHLRDDSDRTALRWSLERMRQELNERQPGASLIAQHLAHMILVQALRLHLASGLEDAGWLFALADRQIGAALGAVHADPGGRWTLQLLAEHAGMSRSGFALRFKKLVGVAPMEYVTRWRMVTAGDRLATTGDPVSVVARSLGYDSESAFSNAFRRTMGCSPRRYVRDRSRPAVKRTLDAGGLASLVGGGSLRA